MNLSVLKKSRRRPQVGDIFVMRPLDRCFLFGRVISTNANPLSVGGALLIYIYGTRSEVKAPIPELRRDALLLPPIMTNTLPWSRGYFEQVATRALVVDDVLAVHCFARTWTKEVLYFDESGNPLAGPSAPVGQFGLHSFRTIDDAVSLALGIPLAADDPS